VCSSPFKVMAFLPKFAPASICRARTVWSAWTRSRKHQAIAEFLKFSVTCAFAVLVAITLCILCVARAGAQAAAPTFHTSTELISVPVVVKDRRGNHVYGLAKGDFQIFENGHRVEIRSFETRLGQLQPAVSAGAPVKHPLPFPPAVGPAPIILFFDQLNTPANEQAGVRHLLALWYRNQQTLAAPTCVIMYTGSAFRILQQPTTEAPKVRAAIESIPTTINSQGAGATGELPLPAGANENLPVGPGDGPLRTIARMNYFWNRAMGAGDTESALIYAGQLFAAWPGEKALIWVSAGTTTRIWTSPLQAVQVKLYPLNVHANIPYEFSSTFTRSDTTYEYETEVNGQLLQNMREAAQETGGELCNNSLQPQTCLQRALDDATDYYLLSYETHSRSSQPEWRRIKVNVDRPGVAVSARSGVMFTPTLNTEEQKRDQLAAALASLVDFPGLRLELQPFATRLQGQELILSLLLRSDAKHPGVWNLEGIDFTVAGVLVSGSEVVERFGEDVHGPLPRKTISDLDASGLIWNHKIAASNDPTVVRLVVRDNATGRIGSITRSVH
jgi:VWFA-related protein